MDKLERFEEVESAKAESKQAAERPLQTLINAHKGAFVVS